MLVKSVGNIVQTYNHIYSDAMLPNRLMRANLVVFMTQGSKTRRFLAFLSGLILHCICFKILFTESKYLASN